MNEVSVTVFEPIKPFIAILARTNQVMTGQFEKWIGLNMNSLKAYVDLGLAQAKVALKVTNPHSLHEFSDSQFAVVNFVGHRMLDDGQALAEWGAECFTETHRLARENTLRLLFKY